MIKRTISALLATTLCISLAIPTFAEEVGVFSEQGLDIPNAQVSSEAEETLESMKKKHIDLGSPDNYRLGSIETYDGEVNLSAGSKHTSSIVESKSASLKSIIPHTDKKDLDSNISDELANEVTENSPPIASLEYLILNPESLYNNQVTVETQIAWLYSYDGTDFTYDPDGDVITGMYVGGIPQECIVGELPDMGFVTQFPQPGTYTLLFQAEDEHGAVSDVWGMNITVVEYSAIRNLNMNTSYGGTVTPTYENSKGYLDYQASMSMGEDPYYIWDAAISQDYPDALPSKRFDNNIQISGIITHPDGTPRANEPVIVYMPLSLNYALYETLTTDSNGKFSVKKSVASDIYHNDDYKYITKGDCTGKETKYCYASKDVNGQNFYYPTTLTIACNYQTYEEDVTATVGYVINGIILGGRWLWSADLANHDPILRWREI